MHRLKFLRLTGLSLAVLLLVYSSFTLVHAPALQLQAQSMALPISQPTSTLPLSWPNYGEAAVGSANFGVVASQGTPTPLPTASTAKIMTALAVLQARPLTINQTATPLITLSQADVDIYNNFVAKDGSVAPVQAGEQISEYQALQALLLPSANNMADSLAIWAYGSVDAYVAQANLLAARLGLANTHISDPSGYSPATVSTAPDLVKLAIAAMKEPVFAEIVGQSKAVIPVAGTIYNVNGLLGRDNLIGIKTGNTDQAGGVFVAAAIEQIGSQKIVVVTAIMGAPNLDRSMLDSLPLLASAKQNFIATTVVKKGTVVGHYTTAWGTTANAVTARDTSLLLWRGSHVTTQPALRTVQTPQATHSVVGTLVTTAGPTTIITPVSLTAPIQRPTFWWRFRHPF